MSTFAQSLRKFALSVICTLLISGQTVAEEPKVEISLDASAIPHIEAEMVCSKAEGEIHSRQYSLQELKSSVQLKSVNPFGVGAVNFGLYVAEDGSTAVLMIGHPTKFNLLDGPDVCATALNFSTEGRRVRLQVPGDDGREQSLSDAEMRYLTQVQHRCEMMGEKAVNAFSHGYYSLTDDGRVIDGGIDEFNCFASAVINTAIAELRIGPRKVVVVVVYDTVFLREE